MMPGLLAAAGSFFAFLLVQVAIFNLFHVVRRFQALVAMWAGLLGLYVAVYVVALCTLPSTWLSPAPFLSLDGLVSFLNGIVVYLLLFLFYCCLYFTDHSLTVAFAIEFDLRGSMTIAELKQRFPYDAMLAQRLQDLINNGYVIREGDDYQLALKGRCFVAVLGTVKRILKLEPGG